jgi:hypothetical protein
LLPTTFQHLPQHLPTPPIYNTERPLQTCVDYFEWTEPTITQSYGKCHYFIQRRSVPNGLPLSPEDLLPQTHAYLTANVGANTLNAPIWNLDGPGGIREDWIRDERLRSELFHQAQLLGYSARHGTPATQPRIYQMAPVPSLQSRRASSITPSSILTDHHGQLKQLPVMQEWRTDNLTSELCPETSLLARHSYSPGAKSVKTSRKLPDSVARREQDKCRQKVETRSNTIAAASSHTLAHHPAPPSDPKPAHAPPAKRHKVTKATTHKSRRNLYPKSAVNTCQSPYNEQGHTEAALNYLYPDIAVDTPPIIEVPLPTADGLPQAIVSKYENYKWSVFHYQLQPKGYDFAQRWYQELLDSALSTG